MREREGGRKKGGRDSRWRNSWLVGFLEEASFGIYSVGKLVGGRWALCVVAVTWPATLKAFPASYFSSFREFLSRMFTFPGSPFEDKRVCEREREREIGFSPFHLSSGQFQIALSRLV